MGTWGRTTVVMWLGLGAALLGLSCTVFVELPPAPDKSDSGPVGDGGPKDGATDATRDSGPCVPQAETCNGEDDDCDGVDDVSDPDTQAACEGMVLNAETACSEVSQTWVCVRLSCYEGFDNCDGDHSNGCEPYCDCHECPDAGSDDGGTDDAGSL